MSYGVTEADCFTHSSYFTGIPSVCVSKPCKRRRSPENALSHTSCCAGRALLAQRHLLSCGEEHGGRQVSTSPAHLQEVRASCVPQTRCLQAPSACACSTSCYWTVWSPQVSVAGDTGEGEEHYPRMQNKLNGLDKITAVHCPRAGEIHRGLMFAGKLHVQCAKYQPPGFPTHSFDEHQELIDFQCAQI